MITNSILAHAHSYCLLPTRGLRRTLRAMTVMTNSDIFAAYEQLPALAAFIVVAESGGFSAAARRTGIDKASLSRRVKLLEQNLGTRLLDRTTRAVHLTDLGRALLQETATRLRDVLLALANARAAPGRSGRVRVTTMPGLNRCLWSPVLVQLKQQHPSIDVIVDTSTAFRGLVATGLDLALRSGQLPETNEVAKKLATWRYIMVASPAWLTRQPAYNEPQEHGDWLLYGDVPKATQWIFERPRAAQGDIDTLHRQLTPTMISSDNALLHQLALDGVGALITSPSIVQEDLATGHLVRIYPDWRIAHTHDIYAVVPHREYMPGAVRIVRAAVEQRLATLEATWQTLSD